MCLHQSDADIYYITQLAWSGNWSATIEKQPASIRMSEYFDNGFLTLMPGKAHTLPPLLISGGASMDNAANHLHRYQNDFLVPKQPAGLFIPVQFNSWFALLGGVTAEKLKPYVAKAADLGCEVFVIDAGWYGTKDWFKQIGDWYANPESFPNGLIETADDVRRHGMKFGLWFELELWGESSKMFNEHPEWCLQYDGVAIHHDYRKHLDFSHPEAFQWALDQFDRIYHECKGIDWVKLDYNNSIGSRFENENGIKTGDRLHRHIRGYYAWLDSLRTRYPEMMIENCASGGLRLDNGIAAHAHTTWLSDETTPNPSIGMAWSSTLEYIPRALNHWMVGRGNHDATIDPTLAAGYYDFMLKIPMNGQFGISSRIIDWSPELFQCAVKNVQLYKRIRTVIATADCYHLTPQPDYDDPTGWMALQYVSPDRKQSVLTAYRTRSSEPTFNAILQGLDLKRKYKVSIDGVSKGVYTGGALMKSGLTIALPDEYRASVVEINEK
jgi:alpha-galactosidase